MDAAITSATFTPTISWAVTPWLSIGAGPNIYVGFMKSKAQWGELPLALFAPEFAENLPEALPGEGLRYLPIPLEQEFYSYGVAVGFNAGDPIGKPAGSFDIFNQSYGIGFTW